MISNLERKVVGFEEAGVIKEEREGVNETDDGDRIRYGLRYSSGYKR